MIKLIDILEGTCGYGLDGELGDEPAGPHLLKKKKRGVDEKVNPDIKQIYKLLIKYGKSAKETAEMMKKHWSYVSKKYKNSSPRGMATAIIGLNALGESTKEGVNEGPQKDRNELALYIIDLNNMLSNAKILAKKDPKAKMYIKLLQKDIKDAEKKMAKLKKVKPIKLKSKSGMGKISHLGMEK